MVKKILKIIAILLAVVILGAVVYVFWQYPYCLINKQKTPLNTNFEAGKIKVMSYNIRLTTPEDTGNKSWFYRADLVLDTIKDEAPGIIGFQEVTAISYKYLCDTLTGYDSIMEYRDDFILSEGCPIFYNTEQFDLKLSDSFWLSETPDVMSKDWGAACYRICSFALLKDKQSGKEFMVFNTHLDHVSDEARINGIKVVLDKIANFEGRPAILMGDLNADESSETYANAMGSFLDSKYQTENTMQSCTYQAWGAKLDNPTIDYILISKEGLGVESYKVVNRTFDGVYSSDHFPVLAELTLK